MSSARNKAFGSIASSRGLSLLLWVFVGGFFTVFTINSFLAQGGDYLVFYQAGVNYIKGLPIYDVARDGAVCYKYPPWITPLLVPFSLLSLRTADVIWRLLSVLSMAYALRWTLSVSKNRNIVLLSFLSFWGSWMYNLIAGQITPLLLALSLFGFTQLKEQEELKGLVTVLFALSAKVFNSIAIIALAPRRWFGKNLVTCGVLFTAGTLPALFGYEGNSPIKLAKAYLGTLTSTGENLAGGQYGLGSLWKLFLSGIFTNQRQLDALAFGISAAIFLLFIRFASKHLRNEQDLFVTAIALAASIHPLVFSYIFIWVFPLAAISVDRALQVRSEFRLLTIFFTLLGLLGVTILDRIPLGPFSLMPIRALSVWILATSLVWVRSRN